LYQKLGDAISSENSFLAVIGDIYAC
jgi:hypothetical protein